MSTNLDNMTSSTSSPFVTPQKPNPQQTNREHYQGENTITPVKKDLSQERRAQLLLASKKEWVKEERKRYSPMETQKMSDEQWVDQGDEEDQEDQITRQRCPKRNAEAMECEWLDYEEHMLTLCVMTFGKKWSKISTFIEGRTGKAAQRHWKHMKNHVKASRKLKIKEFIESSEKIKPISKENVLMNILKTKMEKESEKANADAIARCKRALLEFCILQGELELDLDE